MSRSTNINSPVAPAVLPPIQLREVNTLSAIAAKTATFSSTGVDLLNTGGSEAAYLLLLTGVVSGTTPTMDVIIEESDDNGTWTTVALDSDSPAFAQVIVTTNKQLVKFKRTKRYIRITATIAGTTPSFTMGAFLLR